ncbi:protein phosphatase 1H-like isoform X3 [Rhinoraja longicauda]
MMSRMKAAVAQLAGNIASGPGSNSSSSPGPDQCSRFHYSRPRFLLLSPEEEQRAADHNSRPVLGPGQHDRGGLPWGTGYAEVINAGKSSLNEDQATREVVVVESKNPKSSIEAKAINEDGENVDKEGNGFTFHYWALFDGHAGTGAAVMASRLLHVHICEQLRDIANILQDCDVPPPICLSSEAEAVTADGAKSPAHQGDWEPPTDNEARFLLEKEISHESLVIGAIENAFKQMDKQIERERTSSCILGGCCALAVIYLLGKIYVANAGDSRAYKTIKEDDLKFPLVYGEGKKARVMATIGVTRGMGDHDLKDHYSNIHIKPFLSCMPEVQVYDVKQYEHGVDDVIVMGSDGLWDVASDQEVADAVIHMLSSCEPDDRNRFTLAAQDLVMKSRGVLKDHGWRLSNNRLGSGDDISVFVIPLYGQT